MYVKLRFSLLLVHNSKQQLFTEDGTEELPETLRLDVISTMPDPVELYLVVIAKLSELHCDTCQEGFDTYSALYAHKVASVEKVVCGFDCHCHIFLTTYAYIKAKCSYGYTEKWWKSKKKI